MNSSKLHRLYTEWLKDNHLTEIPVSYSIFSLVVNEWDSKLEFLKPKKDQCFKCNYAAQHIGIEDDYIQHIKRKEVIVKEKAKDKTIAEDNSTIMYATFDVQALLTLPYTADSQLHYSRKLSVINFTVFTKDHDGFCYTYDET